MYEFEDRLHINCQSDLPKSAPACTAGWTCRASIPWRWSGSAALDHPSVQYDQGLIDKIVELCMGLPLAVLMTGSELEIDNHFLTPDQMVDILTQSRLEACDDDSDGTQVRLEAWSRDCSYAEEEQIGPVYRNFIRRLSEVFRQRLAVLGYIPGSFTTGHAQRMLDETSLQSVKDRTLSPLMRRHMVQFDAPQRRYNIHGILKDCLEVYFSIENLTDVRRRYCQTFSEVMNQLSRKLGTKDYTEAVADLAVEHPNLQKLMMDVRHSNQETYPVYIQMVESSSEVIQNFFGGESYRFYTKCLELCEMYDKPRDDAVVSSAYGRVLTNVKADYTAGESMYRRALVFAVKDPASIMMASQLHQNMGWNLHMQGKREAALRHLQEAKNHQIQQGMFYQPVVLTTLSVLAIVNTAIGNFEEGEKYHRESLKRRIHLHGENHPHIGSVYNNMGILYLQMGDIEKSNYHYRKGLEVKRATKATASSIIISLNNVACVEIESKNFEAAEQLMQEAWELLEKSSQIYKFEEGLTLENYGKLYLAMGNYKKAVVYLSKTVAMRKAGASGSVTHVESLISLGKAYQRGGNSEKAMKVFMEALSFKENAAMQMPQNSFIWEGLDQMWTILVEKSGDHSQDLAKVFSDGKKELYRIINHYTEKRIFDERNKFDRILKEWNKKCQKYVSCQDT
ncbi:kinesin light chain 4-like [Haliotis rubra]|uniref:kinesin light chain 4-like n=1 Tax=Haliotis rubra TaxID=36100 RepID=UPI001EE5E289|nr:kinesin light chain 4-like [Haliotis rubra]